MTPPCAQTTRTAAATHPATGILTLDGVSKHFGERQILAPIHHTFTPGQIHTLRGGNGSGKTTLFNIISGFLRPTTGRVHFNNNPLPRANPWRTNRHGIGRTFQDLRLAMQLTVRQNILLALAKKLFARPTPVQQQQADEILDQVALTQKAGSPAGEISYGQQKLLTLGCCIANNAGFLLVDEPVAGIDATNLEKIITLVHALKQRGKTILQIEHHPRYIQATSDITLTLEGGRLKCC